MGIGFTIFLFVVGAILTFAVDVNTAGFDLHNVGIILLVAGLLGLLISAVLCDRVIEERRIDRGLP